MISRAKPSNNVVGLDDLPPRRAGRCRRGRNMIGIGHGLLSSRRQNASTLLGRLCLPHLDTAQKPWPSSHGRTVPSMKPLTVAALPSNDKEAVGCVAPELLDQTIFPVEIGLHRTRGDFGAFIGTPVAVRRIGR